MNKYSTNEQCFEQNGQNETPDMFFEGRRFIPGRLQEAMEEDELRYLRLTGMDGEQVDRMWYYDGGVYRPYADQVIKEEVNTRLGKRWQSRHAVETVYYVHGCGDIPTHSLYQEPTRHTLDTLRINTVSGLVHVATGRLEEHYPDYVSFMQLPVKYDPTKQPGAIDGYVRDTLPEDSIDLFWEFVGYCLLEDCRFKKALLIIGERNTGKSTLLDLLKRFLGHFNTVTTSLQDICDGRFDAANLLHKYANIYSDLSPTKLRDSGKFKGLVAGDSLKGERKHEHAFSFYPTAKHIYSSNNLVPTSDIEIEAFINRWIILKVEKHYHFRPQEGQSRANSRLIDELATPEKSD